MNPNLTTILDNIERKISGDPGLSFGGNSRKRVGMMVGF